MAEINGKADLFADVEMVFEGEDEGMTVSSHVLALASPVFQAMLTSGMSEDLLRRVEVTAEVGTKEQFQQFYDFLLPVTGRKQTLDEGKVDGVLAFSDYYQVADLKIECEAYLLLRDVSADRLIQAEKHGLQRQLERCVRELSAVGTFDLCKLATRPELLLQVTHAMQSNFESAREQLKELARARQQLNRISAMKGRLQGAYSKIPSSVKMDDGRPPADQFVKDELNAVLACFP